MFHTSGWPAAGHEWLIHGQCVPAVSTITLDGTPGRIPAQFFSDERLGSARSVTGCKEGLQRWFLFVCARQVLDISEFALNGASPHETGVHGVGSFLKFLVNLRKNLGIAGEFSFDFAEQSPDFT